MERKAQQPVIKPLELGGIVAKVHITQLHAVIMEVRRERVEARQRRQKRCKLCACAQCVFVLRLKREEPERAE